MGMALANSPAWQTEGGTEFRAGAPGGDLVPQVGDADQQYE